MSSFIAFLGAAAGRASLRLCPPTANIAQAFIYSHLPLEEWWQLLGTYLSAEQFWDLPFCTLTFFTKVCAQPGVFYKAKAEPRLKPRLLLRGSVPACAGPVLHQR